MRIGLRLRAGAQSPVSLAHVVLDAERADLDFVRMADDARPPMVGVNHATSVWPALGAVAVATRRVDVQIDGICVTGPMHPVAIAQLAVGACAMLPGRFSVGFSAGTEHAVVGRVRPTGPVRLRALTEVVDVFRRLTRGERVDQQDTGIVVNDLRLPGTPLLPPSVSITASDESEAALAAELACHLVVPLGADLVGLVAAYRRAGGAGEVSAGLLLAEPFDPASLVVARLMITGPAQSDQAIREMWVDPAESGRLSAALDHLADLDVAHVELMSPAGDPHLAIRQWRGREGAPVVSLSDLDLTPSVTDRDVASTDPDVIQVADRPVRVMAQTPADPGLRSALQDGLSSLADDEAGEADESRSDGALTLADRLRS